MKTIIAAFAFLLLGCASSIKQISSDTYIISKSDYSPGVGRSSSLRSAVLAEAHAMAVEQGKVAVPISVRSTPAYPFHLASFEYQFRVLDKNDPEAIRASQVPFPDEK